MKVAKRRTRLSKLASKIQDRAKRATVGAVNRRSIKRAGLKVLKNNKKFLSRKKVQLKPRFASSTRTKVGINIKGVSRSSGKSQIIARPVRKTSFERNRIIRIMGHGQFTVSSRVLAKLSKVDCDMVRIVSNERPNDDEFRKSLAQLTDIVKKFGKPHNSKEIVRSDIILPSVDLSIDEAKRLFKGEGVIPVT
jgi:hypothetical protein